MMSTSSHNPQYMAGMQRDDASLTTAELIEQYVAAIGEYRRAVDGLTPTQVTARPVPGKWSAIELTAHVVDADLYFSDRILRTIAIDQPLLVGVDERNYTERLHYQSLDLHEELDLFSALRRRVARVLRLQPPEVWTRTAVHTDTGLLILRQLVQQAIRHARHHLPFLAEKRAAFTSAG